MKVEALLLEFLEVPDREPIGVHRLLRPRLRHLVGFRHHEPADGSSSLARHK